MAVKLKNNGLEKIVGKEMKNAGRIGANTAGDEHVGQLADRGIGHNPLDVRLHQGDRGGEEGRDGTQDGNEVQGKGRQGKQHMATRQD